jgi:integrase
VRPLESVVTGFIEAKREAAPLDIGAINIDQLALALAERLKGPQVERPMLGELASEWFDAIAPKRVAPIGDEILMRHLRPLFLDDEATLTVGAITAILEQLSTVGYSASTVNKVRSTGKRIVDFACAAKRWSGPNPFALARRKREPERQYELLTLEELARVEKKLPPERRRLFRVALHTGMRPGEVFALQKSDVDFDAGTINVHRSHERNETKTGKARVIPIPPACAGDLLESTLSSPSEVIFGDEDGELQRADTKLTRILRTAMRAANVGVTSVTYKCRRRGCEADPETHEETSVRKIDCARCGMRLWPVAEVRPVRWYDLRHICATLHHQHKADEVCVARALGHTIKDTTRRIYTHVDMEEMRRELTKWRLS